MQAALYLRSSKDRSDVSIDAQRRELVALAKEKNLIVVAEFSDAVESGKDDNRPGFQSLLAQLKHKSRTWQYLLALDTSRIARNQYLAHALHFECEKRNIKIIYAKMPETGSVVDVVIRAVMQAFDQLHSLMSKEKGLSGMAENVRQGFRAGGRAPLGYQLEHVETGAIRDGEAVTKSRLVLGPRAAQVKAFFALRVQGVSRAMAASQSGLDDISHTTLVGMEWNALTYAGHTVWNIHNEKLSSGGYKGGTKRRPRSEWVINENTHEAFISTESAEAILESLAQSNHSKSRRGQSEYLLRGLLFNHNGVPYHGSDGMYYRAAKGKRIGKQSLESDIVKQVLLDMHSQEFVTDLVKIARANAQPVDDTIVKQLKKEISDISNKINKLMDVITEAESPRPWLDKINQLEQAREKLARRLDDAEIELQSAKILTMISESDVKAMLNSIVANVDQNNVDAIRLLLESACERIVLTETPRLTCEIHYIIKSGDKLASPRRFDNIPALRLIRLLAA